MLFEMYHITIAPLYLFHIYCYSTANCTNSSFITKATVNITAYHTMLLHTLYITQCNIYVHSKFKSKHISKVKVYTAIQK